MAGVLLSLARRGRRTTTLVAAVAVLTTLVMATPSAASGGDIEWVHQYGTANQDFAFQTAATDAAVYVASTLNADNVYPPTQGHATLRSYTHAGTLNWVRSLAGATGQTAAYTVTADDSGIYIGGVTHSALPGQPEVHGDQAAWVARYSDAGVRMWIRQIGLDSQYATGAFGLKATSSGILVSGCVDEACYDWTACGPCDGGFLQLLGRDGTVRWTDRIHGAIHAMDADGGGALLSLTDATHPGIAKSLERIDLTGHVTWTRSIDVIADNVALLSGGAYVITYSLGHDPAWRGWLRAYRSSGALNWDQVVTGPTALSTYVYLDAVADNILIAWYAPQPAAGPDSTTWWASYSPTGTFRWKKFLPPGRISAPSSVLATPRGGYLSGNLLGAFPTATNQGMNDAFVLKFTIDTAPPFVAWEVLCPGDCMVQEFRLPPDVATLDLRWRGSDAGSGIDHFQLQQTSNEGANWSNVQLGDPRAKRTAVDAKPGGSYRFRLRAIDKGGNTSKWQLGPLYTVGLPQETDAAFAYDTKWKPATVPGADGGMVMTASDLGAKATFSFKATSIGLVSTVGPDRGKATVYLDGAKVGVIDLYAPVQISRVVTFTHAWAHPGNHTLQLVVRGTSGRPRVDIDAIEVLTVTP